MITKLLSVIAVLAFIGFGVLLGLLNPTPVSFDYFVDQRHIPLSILLSFAFVLGLLFAGFFIFSHVLRLQWRLHQLNKQYKKQTNEIIELKKQIHKDTLSKSTDLSSLPLK